MAKTQLFPTLVPILRRLPKQDSALAK
jgi:hypothetical protein